ncbi:hypothetical protein GOICGAJE_01641 [Bacillus sp. MB95]|nr:hypothetical protein [Bacillus sp. MB95]
MSFSEYDLRLLCEITYMDLTKAYSDQHGIAKVNDANHSVLLKDLNVVKDHVSVKNLTAQWELILTLQGLLSEDSTIKSLEQKSLTNEYLDAFLFKNATEDEYVVSFRGTNFSIFNPQFWKDMTENLNPLFLSNKKSNRQFFHAQTFMLLVLKIFGSNFCDFQAFIKEQDDNSSMRDVAPIRIENLSLVGHSKGGGLAQKVIYYFGNFNIHFRKSTTFCAPPFLVTSIIMKKEESIPFNQFRDDVKPFDYYNCTNYSIHRDRVIFTLTRIYVLFIKGMLLRRTLKKKKYKKVLPILFSSINLDFAGEDRIIISPVKALTRHRIAKMFDKNFDKNGNLKSKNHKYFL